MAAAACAAAELAAAGQATVVHAPAVMQRAAGRHVEDTAYQSQSLQLWSSACKLFQGLQDRHAQQAPSQLMMLVLLDGSALIMTVQDMHKATDCRQME